MVNQIPQGMNLHRTYPSVRSILLVRFDPGNRDAWNSMSVRVESEPDPYLAQRRADRFAGLTGSSGGQPSRQLETGPRIYSRDDFRMAVTQANLNLGDALTKLPAPDGLSRYIDVSPLKSARRVNSYRLPDELELTLNWKNVPFDSRLIRAMLVLHYEGTVTPSAFANAVPELDPTVPTPTGFLVPATGDNLKYIGQVDEISDTHDESGDVLSLKSRDLTAILIDTKIPPVFPKPIQPGTTIQEVVRALLATNDDFQIIRGPYLRIAQGTQLPKLDPTRYPRLAVSPSERHKQDKTGVTPYVLRFSTKAGDETYWDAITDLCVSHGLVPTIERDQLILMEPRTLYSETPTLVTSPGTPAFPKPGGFRQRIGDTTPVRRMVYGVNIKQLRFFRKLGRVKAPAVRVTSYNPDSPVASKRLLSVYHPPQAQLAALAQAGAIAKKAVVGGGTAGTPQEKAIPSTQATKVDPAGQKQTIEVHNIVIAGIVDLSQLQKIAEQVYEAMGRQELGVTFATDDIASFSDNQLFDPNLDPDLLDLKAGDPIQILVKPTERRGSTDIFSLSELNLLVAKATRSTLGQGGQAQFSDAVAFLVGQGFKRADAEQLVKVLSTANLPQEFRVNTVQINYDGEGADGFSIQVDARDYIRVRADPQAVVLAGEPVVGLPVA